MAGQLLVSGNPQNYSAIGEAGQPIYSVAFQLREAVRLKAGADVANCLAIPQRNEQGSVIDWYAPERGDVVPCVDADRKLTSWSILDRRQQLGNDYAILSK